MTEKKMAYYKTWFGGVRLIEVLTINRFWDGYRSYFDEYVIKTANGKIKIVSGDRIIELKGKRIND